MEPYDVTLRRLAVQDAPYLELILASEEGNREASGLDPKTHALIRIGALVALGAPTPSYAVCVHAARSAGASDEEIVGALVANILLLGEPRVTTEAPKLGLALGYDVEAALERLEIAPSPAPLPG